MRTDYKTAKVIHVKHMLKTAFLNWKVWFVFAVVFAILFGAKDYMKKQSEAEKQAAMPDVKQEEVSVTTEGFYRVKAVVEYEDVLEKQQEYNNNSVLMKIDPVHKWGCTVKYTFTADEENANIPAISTAYLEKIGSSDAFLAMNDGLSEKTEESYLREVITFDTSVAGTIGVNIVYFNEEGTEQIRQAMNQYVEGLFGQIPAEYGLYTVVINPGEIKETVDMQLSTQQNQYKAQLVSAQDNLTTRMTALEENEAAYLQLYREARLQEGYVEGQALIQEVATRKKTVNVSLWAVKKQIVVGGAIGFIIGIVLLCIRYVYSRRIVNAQNIEEMYHIPVLGCIDKKKTVESECEMTAVKLMLKDDKSQVNRKYALSGTVSDEKCKEALQTMLKVLKEQGIEAVAVGNIIQSPEAYAKLKTADAVILVEKLGKTRFEDLAEIATLCEDGNRPVVGVLVIE